MLVAHEQAGVRSGGRFESRSRECVQLASHRRFGVEHERFFFEFFDLAFERLYFFFERFRRFAFFALPFQGFPFRFQFFFIFIDFFLYFFVVAFPRGDDEQVEPFLDAVDRHTLQLVRRLAAQFDARFGEEPTF